MKKRLHTIVKSIGEYWFILCICLMLIGSTILSTGFFVMHHNPPTVITYNQFLKKVDDKQIKGVSIDFSAPTFVSVDKADNEYITDNPRTSDFKMFLLKHDVTVSEAISSPFWSFLQNILGLVVIGLIFYFISISGKRNGGDTQFQNKILQSRTHEVKKAPSVTFNDIAGNESVKKDVQFIIDFLQNPAKYQEMGARMPKGVIFYGPPGTGKTLCAKAVAGEAGVPFFSISGSDFVEMYVGVGARRVRDLFAEARKKAPCIIFIDEIDAVGKRRGIDNNTEKDQTINALLTQLDGFSSTEGIVVIGATNRVEILDEALVRPGRFDKHIAIPLPEYKERVEILKLHSKNKSLRKDVDIEKWAKLTIGFSGAGLETLMNESAIIAVSKGKFFIEDDDIDDAYYKVVMRGDKKSIKDVKEEQLKLVAWHEAGHALVAKLLTKKSVPKVTIIPSTSGAGGVTFIIPDKAGLHTKKELINDVKVSYAGRIAEYLLTNDESSITTGASQDIKQATNLIMAMIKEFGMNDEFGMLYMENLDKSTEGDILKEAKTLSKKIYEETFRLMKENKLLLKSIADALLEKETIDEEELNQLVVPHLLLKG
ncbi:AAA family ATPase (plasmid) [Aneurinibacillus sp. Ricciae_BoGa-3]|uniref:ATP-dependent metallopeptidase FtsH/Yme1/Tma family protein n=1 Tax=Aneurinibacillus sp. Ricciae_BoGa-3 TaxID=3022697 RepID=UPI0023411C2C|nr:AAA family ATPase [Aneurinibacillus sp. Ricciae_BoGa-3]WCK57669.1 AAA family ATPase [Aneurinibacillus sp. Ricciae_BoGa-3]